MEFKFKTQEELAKLSPEEVDTYTADLRKHQSDTNKAEIQAAVDASKSELTNLVNEVKTRNTELEAEIAEIKANTTAENKVENSELVKELKAKKEAIRDVLQKRGKEVVIKALTNRASITNNTASFRLPDIGQLGVKERSLYNIFPKVNLGAGNHNGTISYVDWDEATTVRAAAMVAEGAAFPESTAKFQEYLIKFKKIGDTLPVTEEFGHDEVTAAAELERFLEVNVNTVIDTQLATGPGTGENLTGLITSAPAYTATAQGIADANIYDLVSRVRTDITTDRGSKYMPDFVVMNGDTIDKLRLKKDANNNYIFRNESNNIGSIAIIEDNNIPANQLVVGDRRYGTIYELSGVELSEGTVNAQFTADIKTLKARKRMLFLIREVDKTGFRKVLDVSAALATLATTPA